MHLNSIALAWLTPYDSGLLSTIFAYDAENEIGLVLNQPPFSVDSTYALGGKTYDPRTSAGIQQLADDGATVWADACADVVHQKDPQALVSALTDKSQDPRIPMDPAVLARTRLSFVDIHAYAVTPQSLPNDFPCLNWGNLTRECRALNKPLLMGECGVYTSRTDSVPEAATIIRQHVQTALNMGFQGNLLWYYDCKENRQMIAPSAQPCFYAHEGNEEIFRALQGLSPQVPGAAESASGTPAAGTSPAQDNLLRDPGEVGSWTLRQFNGTDADLAAGGGLKATVFKVSADPADVAVVELGIPLEEGTRYTLSFSAKAGPPRVITVVGIHNKDDYRNVGLSAHFSIINRWQTFTTTFAARNTDGANHNIPRFGLGQKNNNLVEGCFSEIGAQRLLTMY